MTKSVFKILSVLVAFCIFISDFSLFDISAFAAGSSERASSEGYVIWVNGKNINKEKLYYNYISVPMADLRGTKTAVPGSGTPNTSLSPALPSGCRYVLSVTDSSVNSIDDAYRKGKGKTMRSQVSVNYNVNRDILKVTAGTKAGKVKVWIAELYEDTKQVIAYACIDVTVKVADKEFGLSLVEEKSPGVIVTAENTATSNAGSSATIQIAHTINDVSPDTTYNWKLILPKYCDEDLVTMQVADDTRSCTLKLNSILYYDEITYVRIRCVNEQSRNVATYRIRIQNNITSVTGIEKPVKLRSAMNIMRKVTITPQITTRFEDVTDNTDRIKAFVLTGAEGGYEYTKNGKLLITKRAKTVTVTIDEAGRIKLKANAGTPDGTEVRVLYVVIHADRTFDVYESGVITVG